MTWIIEYRTPNFLRSERVSTYADASYRPEGWCWSAAASVGKQFDTEDAAQARAAELREIDGADGGRVVVRERPRYGLRVSIFRGPGPNCSNGGVSSTCDQVTIVGEGVDEVFEATADAPAAEVVRRTLGGRACDYVRPVAAPGPDSEFCGPTAGGCYVSSCDSRVGRVFGRGHAFGLDILPLFDRWDTWAQHEMLTR